jgi:hypothetical protein
MMCMRYFSTLKLSGQDNNSVPLLKKKTRFTGYKNHMNPSKKADSQFFFILNNF